MTALKRNLPELQHLLGQHVMEGWQVPLESRHPLPGDYLERFGAVSPQGRAACRALILAGFILDGELSWRERHRLRQLSRLGVLPVRPADVKRHLRAFLSGGGLPLDG